MLNARVRMTLTDRRGWEYAACGAAVIVAVAASVLVVPGFAGALGGVLALVMMAVAVIDARNFVIPDKLVLAALALGCLDAWMVQSEAAAPAALLVAVVRGVGVAVAFWILREAYVRLRGREGIGLGDIKLAAVAGGWLEFPAGWLSLPKAQPAPPFLRLFPAPCPPRPARA